ncbi:M20/M25/M40 family metallo-hydrolase [Flavobacterium sp.]|uniref:M20/M25/M40 family metallo-hydrolase n=1 Tax=Flavobacterium sp. TaxID=239 RepID=UPI001219654F|nr:M20/M25/M40 family metallo-hydrolase [Flavobacterium sp.]RZJ69897.1 MAG: M20/M25/M40 family metallo-hydrolase [Flavobacterium sp.]
MKKVLWPLLLVSFLSIAQKADIGQAEVTRIETKLASDEMQGRQIFEPGIEIASKFIESEFARIDLKFYGELKSFRQDFSVKGKSANNVIGILPGKSKPDEFVVFSAHYDHLGMETSGSDKIYNGANDDASGVTAVIALADYFKKKGGNERTLIFVAFTGEEIGGFGSRHFSKNIDPDKVVAMFNIEMIGTESKWGKNSAYITGYEKSDFGKILQKNLEGSKFKFEPDPYPEMQLFYRSDNATLAALGVPAHTISTSKMDDEKNYHKLSDEVATLDMANMTEIIKSIAISSQSIISGKETPGRVRKK